MRFRVVMHVLEYLVDVFSGLFRSHRYGVAEKAYAVLLFAAGLSLRDVSERYGFTHAGRGSVRLWAHRLSSTLYGGPGGL